MSTKTRSKDLWALYQKARVRAAKAEIAMIETRQNAEAAEAEYDAANKASIEAGAAWRKSLSDEKEPGQ